MQIKITIETPDFDPHPEKSKTNNHEWRKCVIVQFQGQNWKWLPTYKQLEDINTALNEVELINIDLAREKSQKEG